MKRRFCFLLLPLMALTLLSACHFSLSSLDLFQEEPLICRVTAKEERTLTVEVLEPDSHYDAETVLIVRYRTIRGGNAISIGDVVTFSYDYIADVTVQGDDPCITVDTVEKTQWVPPPSTEEATE